MVTITHKEAGLAEHRDIPPTRTIDPVEAPPDSDNPTTAMLKADIDSGRSGDKVPGYDPGLSQLGTDDEAAGRPPSAFRIALARKYENVGRWSKGGRPDGYVHKPRDGALTAFVGFIAAVAALFVAGIWIVQG